MCHTTCYALLARSGFLRFIIFTLCTLLHGVPLVIWINCRLRDDRLEHFYFSTSLTALSTTGVSKFFHTQYTVEGRALCTVEGGGRDNRVVVLADDASPVPLFSATALCCNTTLWSTAEEAGWQADSLATKCCLSPLQEQGLYSLLQEEYVVFSPAEGVEMFTLHIEDVFHPCRSKHYTPLQK